MTLALMTRNRYRSDMKLARIALSLVVSGVVGGSFVDTVRAAKEFDPGDFQVTMSRSDSGMGQSKPVMTCDVNGQKMVIQDYFTNVLQKWTPSQGQPAAVSCASSQESTMTNAALSGTVTNKSVGAGDITQTCDMRQKMDTSFTLAATMSTTQGTPPTFAVSNFKTAMDGYQACAWAMTFKDASVTKLSGTIEQTFGFSNDTASVTCPPEYDGMKSMGTLTCVPIVMNAKVFVVGGAGEYAGTGGTGSFSNTNIAPIMIPNFGASKQSAGVSVMLSALSQAFASASVHAFAAGDGMKLTLKTGAKPAVRLVSPVLTGASRTLGVGPDGATPLTVKLSAAPGASCGISAKSGTKAKSVLAPKADADGAISTTVTAASLRTKLGVKTGAKVSLSVSCAVGAQRATTTQSVTLGA